MHKVTTLQRWEVEFSDVQGKLSNLYLWPETLTCACLKFQVIRGDVIEHTEITRFFEICGYEVKCNYRFTMDVPINCSHVHLFFISGDIHPVSQKPKLIARSRLSFKDLCRHAPVDKYFTLYRRDRVTQNCIAGGYVRLAFARHRGQGEGEYRMERMSMEDHVSVCSSAREEAFPFTHPYDAEMNCLPPRPSSAVPRMLMSEEIQYPSDFDDASETTSVFGETDRSRVSMQSSTERRKQLSGEHPRASSSFMDRTSKDTDIGPSVASKHSEESGDEGSHPPNQRGVSNIPWFGIAFGVTLGTVGTVAAFTLRYLSRRNSKRRAAKKGMVVH